MSVKAQCENCGHFAWPRHLKSVVVLGKPKRLCIDCRRKQGEQ